MTSVSQGNARKDVLRQLIAGNESLPSAKEAKFAHLSILFETLGPRFVEQIQRKLPDQKSRGLLDKIRETYQEIQENLKNGLAYHVHEFPHTAELMEGYTPTGYNPEKEYANLKWKSYEVLPFPQQGITYPNPDLDIIAAIESARDEAFRNLIRLISPQPIPLNEEQQLGLTRLYFCGGALFHGDRVSYYSELFDAWAGCDSEIKKRVVEQLKFLNWVESKSESKGEKGSFKEFLVEKTVEQLEKRVCRFSEAAREKIRQVLSDESVRTDVSYFSANLIRLYELNLGNRKSKRFLFLLQLYLFIVRTMRVIDQNRSRLFDMLIFAESLEIPDGFHERGKRIEASKADQEAFREAWEGIEMLQALKVEDESNSYSWPVLYFLWKNPDRSSFIKCFGSLASKFKIAMKKLFLFCQENKVLPKDFVGIYLNTLEKLKKKGIHAEHPDRLFLTPPECYSPSMPDGGRVEERSNQFIESIHPSFLQDPNDYLFLLRRYILVPCEFIFELLKDAAAIGIGGVRDQFLYKVLSEKHDPVSLDKGHREQAQGIINKLQKKYDFPAEDLFFLYLEFIRMISMGMGEEIGKTSQVIHNLSEFCPALRKEDIYFLFLYHPKISPEKISQMGKLREEWIRNESMLNCVIIDPKIFHEIVKCIQSFVQPLSSVCCIESQQIKFQTSCEQALLSAFFPPLQPLTDYFRIREISASEISWREQEMATHLGQLKFILGNATLGVYLHWTVVNHFPTLFFSFFDVKSRAAYSIFIPLSVPIDSLKEGRSPFYSLLYTLSQYLLKEEVELQAPYGEAITVEDIVGVKETLELHNKAEESEAILKFLRKVKVAYRNLFLSAATKGAHKLSTYDPRKVAAMGHIFSEGALIPKALLEIEPEPKCYLADQAPGTLHPSLFQSVCDLKPLNVNLLVKKEQPVALPISYKVLDASQLCQKSVDASSAKKWSEKAPPLEQTTGAYVVWSVEEGKVQIPLRYPKEVFENRELFQTYVDFHNLLLKSAWYFASLQEGG
jgi:hypothetical protein